MGFNLKLAQRVAKTDISGIRKVFDLAAKLENPVNLSIGQPDFDVPEEVRTAACEAINGGKNSYTQTQGCPELRNALLNRIGCKPEELLVTSAVSGGLELSFLAILDPGDEILVPDPYFVMYKQLALMLGAKPVYYDIYPDWKINPEKIESLITPKTKAIVLGSPSNPTGAVTSEAELKALTAILDKHGVIAISDEIYDLFTYDEKFCSIGEFYSSTLRLGGLSKSHAMTGWRVGWAWGPSELIQAMTKFQQFTFVCAPSMAQIGAATALSTDMGSYATQYKNKRDLIYNGLIELGYEVEKPGGAFYIFPKVPWGDDMSFVAKCIENSLLVIPGSVFSEKHSHFRISYAAKDETIHRGLEILGKLLKEKPCCNA